MEERIREVLENLAFSEPWGYAQFTKLQIALGIGEKDIDQVIDRMLNEFAMEEIIEHCIKLGIKEPEILELASEVRESLPIDIIMQLTL